MDQKVSRRMDSFGNRTNTGFADVVVAAVENASHKKPTIFMKHTSSEITDFMKRKTPGPQASKMLKETEVFVPILSSIKRIGADVDSIIAADKAESIISNASFKSLVTSQMPRTPPAIRVNARRLDHQWSFKAVKQTPLYMIDFAGDQLICRKRASSLTNQDDMTEHERRLFNFMRERLGQSLKPGHANLNSLQWERRHRARIYTHDSVVVDPRMSSFSSDGTFDRNVDGMFTNRYKTDITRYLTPMTLPPMYTVKPKPLVKRDFSKKPPPSLPMSKTEWLDYRHIRYIRPKAKRFQTPVEMEYPYMWK